MSIAAAALFLLLGGLGAPLTLVDGQDRPVAAATVTFNDAAGAHDVEHSDAHGEVAARSGFDPTSARVEADGFVPATIDLSSATSPRIALSSALPVIGTVRVATGSQSSLHRLPVAASLLDRSAVANAAAATSDNLLSQLPGVDRVRSNSAFTNYGQLRVSFTGAGTDRGYVSVDGVPAQDAFGGQIDWLAYPVGNITRAELLRGAGSALYGSGAVGGALALSTRGPQDSSAPLDGELSGFAGGYSQAGGDAFVRGTLAPKLAASLWTSTTAESYDDLAPGYQSKLDQAAHAQSDATQLRLRYGTDRSNLSFAGLYATDTQQEGRPNYSFARNLEQYALQYAFAGEHAYATFNAYERDANITNVDDLYPTTPGALRYVQHVPTWENGLSTSLMLAGGPSEFQVRAELRSVHGISNQDGPSGALQNLGSGSQQLAGFVLQETIRSGRFEALAGARYDNVAFTNGQLLASKSGGNTVTTAPARDNGAVSPRAALRYDLSPNVALRLSGGAGFRAPYLNELVRGYFIGSTQYAPNIALVPERSYTNSVGIDVLGGTRSHLSLDTFETKVSDGIDFQTISPTLQQRANVDHTRTDGTTLTYTQTVGPCTRLRASGTTQYARIVQGPPGTDGKRLQLVPNEVATLGADFVGRGVQYSVAATYSGQIYNDDLNTQPLGASLLFDARATVPLNSGASFWLAWQNVTHQYYLTSIDRVGPPSAVSVRFTLPLGERPAPSGSGSCAPI
ncbi:MAG: TonB-dependent receptor plug domain-containing protein [Vulcanimicrobiaceae bacterium]